MLAIPTASRGLGGMWQWVSSWDNVVPRWVVGSPQANGAAPRSHVCAVARPPGEAVTPRSEAERVDGLTGRASPGGAREGRQDRAERGSTQCVAKPRHVRGGAPAEVSEASHLQILPTVPHAFALHSPRMDPSADDVLCWWASNPGGSTCRQGLAAHSQESIPGVAGPSSGELDVWPCDGGAPRD